MSSAVAEYAASEMRYWCATDSYGGVGYSQPRRWSAYDASDWAGWLRGPGEMDCSAGVAGAYNIAFHECLGGGERPEPFPRSTWTGSLRSEALARGFVDIGDSWTGSVPDGGLQAGDLLLVDPGHVAMVVRDADGSLDSDDPLLAEAWIDAAGDIDGSEGDDGSAGDDTGGETRLIRYSDHPRTTSASWSTCLRYTGPAGTTPDSGGSTSSQEAPAPAGPVTAVDVSVHQDPAAVTAAAAAGAALAIVKASEGIGYTDPSLGAHVAAARAAGMRIGLYHFARNDPPDPNDAGGEAGWFAQVVAPYLDASPVLVLDFEAEGGTWDTSWALTWLGEVQRLTGRAPVVYMSASVAQAHDWSAVAAAGYPLWVAGYPADAPDYLTTALTCPYTTGAWASPVGWQYTSTGRVPGYDGDLDLSVFWRAPGGGPAPALSPGRTRQGPWRDVTAIQAAVHAVVDNIVGPDTRLRVSCVAQASQWYGVAFPEGVAFTQECVGADPDGVWGPASQAAHDTTVAAVQAAVGVPVDCLWGDVTEAAVTAALDAGEQA